MAGVTRCDFSDIMQAIEDKFLADAVVADASLITWAVNDNVPQLSGPFDVLMRARKGMPTPTDGGAWDFRELQYVDITIRSQSIKDSGGSNKGWVKTQNALSSGIINSLLTESPNYGHFWPSNSSGDLLTVSPLKVHFDLPPERKTDQEPWGDSVCTLEIHYMPLVTPQGK